MVLLLQCGGSGTPFTPLKKPVSIALSSTSTAFENQITKFVYVVDAFTQSVAVIDTLQEKIIDTYEGDDFDYSPIPVGGEPSAVAIDDESTPYRIYVADRINKQILAYEISGTNQPEDNFVSYKSISLGGAAEGKNSRPLFKDADAASSPTMTNVVVDPVLGKNEAWKLTSDGHGQYEVLGTVSGLQTKRAIEGKTYTSDDGGLKFYISAGGEKTTGGDQFFFSTFVAKPHLLLDSPVDLLIHGRKLYILTQNTTASIIVYDLDSLAEEGTFAVPDPGANVTHLSFLNNKIYVSNLASGDIFSFNTIDHTFTTISTGLSSIKFVGVNGDHLFLVNNSNSKVSIADLSGTITKTLNLNDSGSSFFTATVAGKTLGLIPNISGNVDVIDVNSLKRVDTDLNEKSAYVNPQFFDVSPVSSPQLISVNGKSGVVMDEVWQMTYEGVLPGTLNLAGTIAGSILTAATATFQDSHVSAGDIVVISGDEFAVDSVTDQTHLTFTNTPSVQGNIEFEIRASGNYVVTGSKSGPQLNRVVPGEAYTSDHAQISLRTRPSFSAPETRGDFFSFQTLDPIDPILINNQSLAVDGIVVKRISDGIPMGYILGQTNGQVSIVNLNDYSLEKTL